MTPLEVTGEASGEIRRLVPDIETLARRLADVDYLVDEGLATSMFLSAFTSGTHSVTPAT